MDITGLTIKGAREALDAGEYTATTLTQAHLDVIAQKNPELNAYLEVFQDSAVHEAKQADNIIANNEQQDLTGIPIAIKDNMLMKGKVASAACKLLENYEASYNSTVIQKLRNQGAVILGRTNMDEFAMGSSTENSAFGITKNPHDFSRVPGGSSGGSASAVAADIAVASLGSDTGGSIRQPASLCGIVGLKPTYGNVSRYGIIALGSSLDQVGPLTKTVGDAEILYNAIAGHDEKDSTSLQDDFFTTLTTTKKQKIIGVPRDVIQEGIDADVLGNFEKSLEQLKSLGYEIKDIELPNFKYTLPAYYIIMPAEASSNLARFDGIRYGVHKDADTFAEVYGNSRGSGFGVETRRRILTGTYVLSSGYYDAYYNKAIAVKDLVRNDIKDIFSTVDIIATPTSPEPAFKLGEKSDPLKMYATDIFTVPANITGVPAISIPAGEVEREGKQLPTGLQLMTKHGRENALFEVGKKFENIA